MEQEELEAFRNAGKIAAKIREESKGLIMVDASLLDIAETIEQMIEEEGAKPAFPVNVSINEIAAHYTPEIGSEALLGDSDLVKIDLGIDVDGALSDTAYTIDLGGGNSGLVSASEEALEAAISAIRPGVSVGEIGGVIEDAITKHGFRPISNLTGHMIKSNALHAGIEIPNVRSNTPYQFKPDDIFAVEPFATDGEGYVEDMQQVEIFSVFQPGNVRMRQSRKIIEFVLENYGMLPFAERWLRKEFKSRLLVSAAIKELLQHHVLRGYPVLREVKKGMISQAEHTILITDDGCEVLTR
ncbi:MAG: type II methionyl aminopeptidase [Candidatus Micrarchaeota archaeon]